LSVLVVGRQAGHQLPRAHRQPSNGVASQELERGPLAIAHQAEDFIAAGTNAG